MTGLLVERELLLTRSDHRAMAEVGGLWAVPHWASRWDLMRWHDEIIDEARQRDVRALEVGSVDVALVEALPDLEFLMVAGMAEGALIERFTRLRWLGVATWTGSLDFANLPRLEWLGVGECEPGNLDSLVPGHPSLRHLIVGRYPFADLGPLGRLRLRRLSIGNSRRLTSLEGAAALAPILVGLDLWMLPALGSLDGIEALADLEVLALSGLRQITTLDWVQRLPRLRLLNVFDLKNVESLRPLAGHPSLEFVTFGRTKDFDLEPLAAIPNLRLMHTGSYRWNRDIYDFPHMDNVPFDHPVLAEYRRLLHG